MTQALQPETIFNDLADEIRCILDSGQRASEFELKRLQHAVGKLAAADAPGASELKGLLALSEGDVSEMKACYENALRLDSDHGVIIRYVQALRRVGDAQAIEELYNRLFGRIRITPDLLRCFRNAFGACGLLKTSRQLEAHMRQLRMEAEWFDDDYDHFFEATGYTEWDLQKVIQFSQQFLRTRGVAMTHARFERFAKFPDGEQILYEIAINAEPAPLVELEEALFIALSEQSFPIEANGQLVVGLSSIATENANLHS
jgi:hypothetical protein